MVEAAEGLRRRCCCCWSAGAVPLAMGRKVGPERAAICEDGGREGGCCKVAADAALAEVLVDLREWVLARRWVSAGGCARVKVGRGFDE